MIVTLSDKQTIESTAVEKAELYRNPDRLLITLKNGSLIKVQGSGAVKDADLLDEIKEQGHLSYGVFRK